MRYTEVSFLLAPCDPWRDILMVELAELGYDSFEESFTDMAGGSGELKAYIPTDKFKAEALGELMTLRDPHVNVSWTSLDIADRNWNAEWERNFKPVEVGTSVRIRADHHPSVPGFTHELVITPRMAFGTGHHATTRMMVQAMLGLADAGAEGRQSFDMSGKDICDLGCGTGVLAILAERMGAATGRAIDIDQAAVDNALVNIAHNDCHRITVEKGDAEALKGHTYDLILANIERNVLLNAMPVMAAALRPGGALFLSGFVVTDRHMLAQRAKECGLELAERLNEGDWALLRCRKPSA
ncbi:MAG: 50S ribosomal protein L11 methyltransferase [Flavobacteriales bacterium]|nr:50S ribosomal protein L11 methyltransferase [Flavobacteriales bacterium]